MSWFGWVLWHINQCRLFNTKSFLFIYIKYIGFGLVGFYGISTIIGYLMPNPLYIHTYIYIYIYIKYIGFGLVGFYGISTIVGYLIPNPLYIYIYRERSWFVWVLWHINYCRLFNAKSSLYIYIKYIGFGLVCFYALSTTVGYLILNPLYIYIYIYIY